MKKMKETYVNSMDGKKCFLIFAVLLFLASIVHADLVFSNFSYSTSDIRPGTVGSLTFTLTNTYSKDISVTVYPYSSAMKTLPYYTFSGTLGAGGSTQVIMPFTVSQDIRGGNYNIQLKAYWSGSDVSGDKTYSVPLTVNNPPILYVTLDRQEFPITETSDMTISITNMGGSIKDAVLTINSTTFILGSSQVVIGNLDTNQSIQKNISISVISSSPGTYLLPITLSYFDEKGTATQQQIDTGPINVISKSASFIINIESIDDIHPGDAVKLNINIQNNGNALARSVKASIPTTITGFTPLGPTEKSIGDLYPGENATVAFELGVSTDTIADYYPIPLNIDYSNSRGEKQPTVNKTIGIKISAVSTFLVIPTLVQLSDGSQMLSLQIGNTGTSAVNGLVASVASDDLVVLDAKEVLVGLLRPNEFSTAQFKVRMLRPSKALNVSLSYLDEYGRRQIVIQPIDIDTSQIGSTSQATGISNRTFANQGRGGGIFGISSGGLFTLLQIIVGAVVVAIIIYIAYTKFFKKKRDTTAGVITKRK